MTDESSGAAEILEATYRALCDHGYAALTMQDIANEAGKSKSLLHYHYDTKEDLLVAFIDHLLTDFERRVEEVADRPPAERLVEFLGWFVFEPDDGRRQSFHAALLELRSQAPFNDRFREQLQRSDDLLRSAVADVLRDGIADGTFREVDVDETAALIVATVDGARTRQLTLGDETYTGAVADAAIERVIEPILDEDVDLPSIEETEWLDADQVPGALDGEEVR